MSAHGRRGVLTQRGGQTVAHVAIGEDKEQVGGRGMKHETRLATADPA